VYSITSGYKTSYNNLIEMVKQLYPNTEIRVGEGKFSVLDDYATIDISRAKSELGYMPSFDIKSGVESYATWLETNPF
jgi:nucleoside-diphosphate-sugar epimerase